MGLFACAAILCQSLNRAVTDPSYLPRVRGHMRERSPGHWEVVVYAGVDTVTGKKRYERRTVHGTRTDAEAAVAELLVAVGRGHHAGAQVTVEQLLATWIDFAAPGLSPSTARDYRRYIDNHLTPRLGHLRADRLSAWDIDTLLITPMRTAGLASATIRRALTVLSSAMAQAVRWRWAPANPVRDATPPPVLEHEISPPADVDVAAYLTAALELDPAFAVWLRLDAVTGARKAELCALRWPDLDVAGAQLTIARALVDAGPGIGIVEKDTKTHQIRVLALDDGTLKILAGHRRAMAARALEHGTGLAGDAYIFARTADGATPWRPDSINKRLNAIRATVNKRLQEAAGDGVDVDVELLPHLHPHELRHFVATQLLAAGIDIKEVSGRLGWKRATMGLDRYGHFMPARDRAASDVIGRIVTGDA